MEIENLTQEKIKQELINRILKQFSYKVEQTDRNANMQDFNGFHYKIQIKNNDTKIKRSFNFSVGIGWNTEQRNDRDLFLNILTSLFMDRFYIDKEELKGIYENEKQINKIHKAILKNYNKMVLIGLEDFFNNLNEIEEEFLNNGL